MWKLLLFVAAIVVAVAGMPPEPQYRRKLPPLYRPYQPYRPKYRPQPKYRPPLKYKQPFLLPPPPQKQRCPLACPMDWNPVCCHSDYYGYKTFNNKCHFMNYAACTDPSGRWNYVSYGECRKNISYEDRQAAVEGDSTSSSGQPVVTPAETILVPSPPAEAIVIPVTAENRADEAVAALTADQLNVATPPSPDPGAVVLVVSDKAGDEASTEPQTILIVPASPPPVPASSDPAPALASRQMSLAEEPESDESLDTSEELTS